MRDGVLLLFMYGLYVVAVILGDIKSRTKVLSLCEDCDEEAICVTKLERRCCFLDEGLN